MEREPRLPIRSPEHSATNPFGVIYQWKVRLFILLLALLVATIVCMILSNRGNGVVVSPATEADVEKAVKDTNVLMPHVSVERVDPIVDAASHEQMLTYLIEARFTNEYQF